MRLTPFQIKTICKTAEKSLGQNAQVWLFGSRVNDDAKGGDIDLYIELLNQNDQDLIIAKLRFLCELHKQLGEQKIDVVLRNLNNPIDLPIYQVAKQTGVILQ